MPNGLREIPQTGLECAEGCYGEVECMEPEITEGAKFDNKPKTLAKRMANLDPGEEVFFIGNCPGISDGLNSFYLTTFGFAGFLWSKIEQRFMYRDVAGYSDTKKGGVIIRLNGDARDISIQKLNSEERFALKAALDIFPRLGSNIETWHAWVDHRKELAAEYVPTQKEIAKEARKAEVAEREASAIAEADYRRSLKERAATKTWPNTRLPNGSPNKASGLTILQHCHDGEEPWFILKSSQAGCLACFDDRLMVVKAGNMQGFMAGAMFGGRSATFYFHDINAIEFNKQPFGSVLEILTASYQGTGNHDFWRGASKSRNADSGDPWTLSNTLPIDNREYLNAHAEMSELRRRIADAKRPVDSVPAQIAPSGGRPMTELANDLVSQLAKLGELRNAGVLTDEEFQIAKSRMLSDPNA